jgi:hypothetical protein
VLTNNVCNGPVACVAVEASSNKDDLTSKAMTLSYQFYPWQEGEGVLSYRPYFPPFMRFVYR